MLLQNFINYVKNKSRQTVIIIHYLIHIIVCIELNCYQNTMGVFVCVHVYWGQPHQEGTSSPSDGFSSTGS